MSKVQSAWCLALLALAAAAALGARAAAEQPAAIAATFSGQVLYSEEAGLLDFSGELVSPPTICVSTCLQAR
jgi:hypothetical protein